MKNRWFYLVPIVFCCVFAASGRDTVFAQPMHHGHEGQAAHPQPAEPFRASTEKPFPLLMDEAMATMHTGMDEAPKTGDPDHDFVTMMIPHHQGAVDMAKVLLLYGKDPELRTLALQIITDQQYEIQLMQKWLNAHRSSTGDHPSPLDRTGGK